MAPLLGDVGAVIVGAVPPKFTLFALSANPDRVGVAELTVKLTAAVALEYPPDAAWVAVIEAVPTPTKVIVEPLTVATAVLLLV